MSEQGASSHQGEKPQQVAPAGTPKLSEKTIEIKLTVPAYDVRAALMPAWLHIQSKVLLVPRRILITSGSLGLLIISSYITYQLLSLRAPLATAQAIGPTLTAPNYPTKLPAGKTIQELGGWKPSSPPGHTPAFAYADKIGSSTVTVIQQSLPDDFKKDTTKKVSQLAVSFNATQKVTVDHTTIYIATSAQGPQTALFNMDNVLVIITSRAHIDTNAWVKYINSLR